MKEVWSEYWQADVYLLIGGLALGVVAGITAAVFCAGRPRSLATRAVETAGLIFYSMPAYLFGFGVLLLFEPSFGALPLPFFFHPLDYQDAVRGPVDVRAGDDRPLDRRWRRRSRRSSCGSCRRRWSTSSARTTSAPPRRKG